MKLLFIGDIVGRRARTVVRKKITEYKTKEEIDFVVANVENASNGVGITDKAYLQLRDAGIDAMTSGNHIWDKKDFINQLDNPDCVVIRPANYPPGVPGMGYRIATAGNLSLLYINIMGRVFMGPNLDDPFRAIDTILSQHPETKYVLVDFHGEATSEKAIFGHYIDGRVSVMVGTHTHIQTADNHILPKGTGFITDVGMVGPLNSSLGINFSDVLMREKTQLPVTFSLADGPIAFNAVLITLDDTGKCQRIERIYDIVELSDEQDKGGAND